MKTVNIWVPVIVAVITVAGGVISTILTADHGDARANDADVRVRVLEAENSYLIQQLAQALASQAVTPTAGSAAQPSASEVSAAETRVQYQLKLAVKPDTFTIRPTKLLGTVIRPRTRGSNEN